jgi:cell division protein FtsI (penicillin-binding protein 3)
MVAEQQGRKFRVLSRLRAWPGRRTASAPTDWRATIRTRLVVGAVLFGVWTVGIEARLVYLQVVQYQSFLTRAQKQQMRTVTAPAKRGEILDRSGRVLAYSVDADSVFADPSEIEDPDAVASAVCGALDECDAADRQAMAKKLRGSGQFAYLQRKVSPDEEQRIRDLKLKGVGFLKESRRYYPNKELAAHVLGYVGLDNAGLGGLESSYDSQVKGREGRLLVQTDARQQRVYSQIERAATAGATLELTLDQYLQFIAERELRVGVEENRAAGGTAVIMDPNTGEILAMANYPTFNPNTYGRVSDQARRNRAIQDLYEPGSTFKIVTASAALEEHVLRPNDLIECSPGRITFGSRVIRDTHQYGTLTFTDVLVKSSNVGAIKAGMRLGPERLGQYVTRFGFGQSIAPDFRGENPGIVWSPERLDPSALASVSMGYQVGVTAVQMASAVSSVANGGTLYEPRIVRSVIKDGKRTEVAHKALRRTISETTASELTTIMEQVVGRGTATSAQIDGFTVAGKTGTAQKLVDRRYSHSDYNASFIGFVPSRKPALAIVVVIDSPHAKGYYGGTVAAPIFKRIAQESLRHLGVGPTINPAPPVLVARAGVEEMVPHPVSASQTVDANAPAAESAADDVMPDLRGLSAREALRALTKLGMTARMSGDGFVLEQSPAAGSPLGASDVCVMKLGRRADAGSERRGSATSGGLQH